MAHHVDERIRRACALIESGMSDEAVELLRQYTEEHPDSIEGWYNLGVALTECDQLEEAEKAYDEALAIDSMVFEVWYNKGNVLYMLADFKGARKCYERALELEPEDAECWNNLGNTFSRLGEGRKAMEAYTHALALRPDYAEALYNKANAHFIEEDDERAIAYAELAMTLDPALAPRVHRWLQVARDRLRSRRLEEEHRRRAGRARAAERNDDMQQ